MDVIDDEGYSYLEQGSFGASMVWFCFTIKTLSHENTRLKKHDYG